MKTKEVRKGWAIKCVDRDLKEHYGKFMPLVEPKIHKSRDNAQWCKAWYAPARSFKVVPVEVTVREI